MGQTQVSGVETSLGKRGRGTRLGEGRWRELIEGCRRSGVGVSAFCSKHGVSVSSFYAWRRRLGSGSSPRKPRSKGPVVRRSIPTFTKPRQARSKDPSKPRSRQEGRFVQVTAANPLLDLVEVVLPRGVVIRVPVSCLAQVIQLLDRDA